jgi:hypothetical protein
VNFFDFVAAQQSTYVSQPLNKLRVKAEKVREVKVAVHGDIMISGAIGGKSGIKYSEFASPGLFGSCNLMCIPKGLLFARG